VPEFGIPKNWGPILNADRVAALFPAAPAPEQDPENKTRLTPEHSFPVSLFLEPNKIAEDDVVRWLFERLHVPRRVTIVVTL
ncbi:hypothetical protein FRC07_009106, partial [Ceratobasidium sp. 392]